jgi:hypothetical protein
MSPWIFQTVLVYLANHVTQILPLFVLLFLNVLYIKLQSGTKRVNFLRGLAAHSSACSFVRLPTVLLQFKPDEALCRLLFYHYHVLYAVNEADIANSAQWLGYGLHGRGSISGRSREVLLSLPPCPGRHWDQPSLLSNGYRGSFPPGVNRKGHESEPLTSI